MGIEYLRYGPLYYKVHPAPGKYDWSFVDETFKYLQQLNIISIVDLCHFIVPDWIVSFKILIGHFILQSIQMHLQNFSSSEVLHAGKRNFYSSYLFCTIWLVE